MSSLLLLFFFFLSSAKGCSMDASLVNATSSRLRSSFVSMEVHDEFIVKFSGFYNSETRLKYVAAALNTLDDKEYVVKERMNAMANYPSDFDVLMMLSDKHIERVIAMLERHPLIKSVTPQRMVTRTLHYVKDLPHDDDDEGLEDDDEGLEDDDEGLEDDEDQVEWLHDVQNECDHPPCTNRHWSKGKRTLSFGPPSWPLVHRHRSRRLLRAVPRQITSVLQADSLWAMGISGHGVRVAIFDTGLAKSHPNFRRIRERSNWTNEKTLDDGLGHGSFVAGVIASSAECLGLAPDVDLHIFRVFTNKQVSYTSWFLDAFNYAILKKIHVLNLSIGGPDFMDRPFVEKVWELTANNVVLVSAIGNDGPLYGTLNNPADQMDVVGVGGIDFDDQMAKFSSRGMTTWELPFGYGRIKPDLVTYGASVRGLNNKGGCRALSGTSVASPVVAGAIALMYSGLLHKGKDVVNVASVKQCLMASAKRLPGVNLFEQGAGKLNLMKAFDMLNKYKPQASLSPGYVDLTECQYFWPYCTQPLFHSGMPIVVNVTILNGMSVSGRLKSAPTWHPHTPNSLLDVSMSYSEHLWPWSGFMALHLRVKKEGFDYDGTEEGHVELVVETDDGSLEWSLKLPLRVQIVPTPPRQRRVLWDQYHNLRYPPGYFPRDNLHQMNAVTSAGQLDWNADHVHTNFKSLYTHLRSAGYYVDVLGEPYTCFDASNYGTLLLVDPEEEFSEEEKSKLVSDVDQGLSLAVFAEWYNTSVIEKVKLFDEMSQQWWIPETGGSNLPALNELLSNFGIGMSDTVVDGSFNLGSHEVNVGSGTTVAQFPDEGLVLLADRLRDQGEEMLTASLVYKTVPILGLYQTKGTEKGGRVVVFGDSDCLDDANRKSDDCFWMIDGLLEYTNNAHMPSVFAENGQKFNSESKDSYAMLLRPERSELHRFSHVLNASSKAFKEPQCRQLQWAEAVNTSTMTNEKLFRTQRLLSLDLQDDAGHGQVSFKDGGNKEIDVADEESEVRDWLGFDMESDALLRSRLRAEGVWEHLRISVLLLFFIVCSLCYIALSHFRSKHKGVRKRRSESNSKNKGKRGTTRIV